jgi:tetratricopeptide (TPR) repeat protein
MVSTQNTLKKALALHQAGRLGEAEALYVEILKVAPREANAHNLLGVILRDRNQFDSAIRSISQALELRPTDSAYYNNLGTCYLHKKEFIAADALFRHATGLNPDNADAWSNLGAALRKLLRLDEAIQALLKAINLAPEALLPRCTLANVLQKQHKLVEALAYYQEVLDRKPGYAQALQGKSDVLFEMGKYEESVQWADAAANAGKAWVAEAMMVKAQALEIMGRSDEACEAVDRGLLASPGSIELTYVRTRFRKVRRDEPFFSHIERFAPQIDTVVGMNKARVGYALGKTYEDVGDFAKASHFYGIGTQAARQSKPVNEDALEQTYEIIAKTCTAEYLAGLQGASSGSRPLIFILGMPRSGTTLVEQVLASHPQVIAGGELDFAHEALDQYLLPGNFKFDHGLMPELDMHTPMAERGRVYIEKMDALFPERGDKFITDKMPGNFKLLGLIAAMLPEARIIHCRRDPIDNCISCYTQLFTSGHEWTYDLGELGRFYRRYWGVMEHWRKTLPGRFLEVRYEQMVDHTEQSARRLLEWCGLAWDPQVLRFYETERHVKTASVSQVRQPIYKSSSGRWKKWEPYIQPLLTEIGDIEASYWAELESLPPQPR